ncbi:hypothetical protein QQG55_49145 [Brugia pahangi]
MKLVSLDRNFITCIRSHRENYLRECGVLWRSAAALLFLAQGFVVRAVGGVILSLDYPFKQWVCQPAKLRKESSIYWYKNQDQYQAGIQARIRNQ